MRRLGLALLLLGLTGRPLLGDGIILNDGRKLSGRVSEKGDGIEIVVDGQTLSFAKEEVKQWIKSPKEVVGDADRLYEEAKLIYQDAVVLTDEKAADAKFREALPRVIKAREAYAEARELFPEGYSELDVQLIKIMKLMRLVRERIGSQIAGPPSVVKAKEEPPPQRVEVKAVESKPEPPPPAAGTLPEALAVLVDPARRGDAAQRAQARATLRKASGSRTPFADLATAGYLFLSRYDEDWQLLSDVVTVKTASVENAYKGRLEKESDAISWLILPDGRRVRLRTASDGSFVTPPGGTEFKAVSCKVAADQKSEGFEALQAFFGGLDPVKIEQLSDKEISEGVKFLALKVKELRAKGVPVDALSLFVAGPASALIAKNAGKPTPELEAAFKDLGFEKSEFSAMWGRKEGIAMDDFRKWIVSGEYGMGVIQFQSDYKGMTDPGSRYAFALLLLFKALSENRNYARAASSLETSSRDVPSDEAKDHFLALAKSIRNEAPCNACGGTHKVNCTACKGKMRLNLECNKCGGSGKINSLRGVVGCSGCGGKGRFVNVECPKCKATGKTDCKARGCKPVSKPTFESFADAYKCTLCQGRGSLMRHVAFPCPECIGVGLILQPKADPQKLLK